MFLEFEKDVKMEFRIERCVREDFVGSGRWLRKRYGEDDMDFEL